MRILLLAGLAVAAAAPLLAQTATVAPVARVSPMADGAMSRAELDAKVRAHFARLDVNRDGFLTTEETAAKRHGKRTGERRMRDPNAAFDRLDANRNGTITRDEFAQGRHARMEKRAAIKRQGVAPGQPGAMRMGGGNMLRLADANRDGRVTLAEASAGAARHFAMMDSNRDGRVTREERRAGRATMRRTRVRQPG